MAATPGSTPMVSITPDQVFSAAERAGPYVLGFVVVSGVLTVMLTVLWPKVFKPWLEMRLQLMGAARASEEAKLKLVEEIRELQRDVRQSIGEANTMRESMEASMEAVGVTVSSVRELLSEVREAATEARRDRNAQARSGHG